MSDDGEYEDYREQEYQEEESRSSHSSHSSHSSASSKSSESFEDPAPASHLEEEGGTGGGAMLGALGAMGMMGGNNNNNQGNYDNRAAGQDQYGGGYNQGGYGQGGYGGHPGGAGMLPSGGPPPGGYAPTSGAGFVPPQHNYVAPQPPYGHQAQGGSGGQRDARGNYFEYSTCSGRRKALLIGINYFGSGGELAGCINDVHNVQRFICERFGYNPADIVVLTDDANTPQLMPTKTNILRAFGWLVEGAQRDDALFLHYSGHGTHVEDVDGDEHDGDDEAICPVDYEQAGLIIDDDSDHDLVVKPLPAGCRLTAIFDSCHSGTVMDLPYVYSTEGKIKEPDYLAGAQDDLVAAGMAAIKGNSDGMFKGLMSVAKGAFQAKRSDLKSKKDNTSPADVIQWSGCKDDQTSADTQEAGRATGAMSYAFIAALTKYPNQSYQQLLQSVREEMRGKYSQKPQLSACHPIDTDLMFVA